MTRYDELHKLAEEVAEYLPGWFFLPPQDDDKCFPTAYITPGGHEQASEGYRAEKAICLRDDSRGNKPRLEIFGAWPRGEGSAWYGPDNGAGARIGVSATKTAKQIANDIARRFLPTYLEQWAAGEAKRQEHLDYQARKQATLDDLLRVPVTKAKEKRWQTADHLPWRAWCYDLHIEANVESPGQIKAEFRELTVEQFAALVEVLAR